jgi:hypothetical protein
MDSRWVGVPGVVVLACALLSGCGSGSEQISASNAASLHSQVDAIRAAFRDGKNSAAQAAVADLRSTIQRLAGTGELDPADGVVLLTQVDRLAARVDAQPTPTPVPTVTPAPPAPPDNGGPAHGPKKPKPKDKGKGPHK